MVELTMMDHLFLWHTVRRAAALSVLLVFALLGVVIQSPQGSEAGRVLRHMHRSFRAAAPSPFITPEERRNVQEHWDSLHPSGRVVYLRLESSNGASVSLPFVPASARHALPGHVVASSVGQSESAQPEKRSMLRSFATQALAATVVGLSFMFVRDLFRAHKRRRLRKKAQQVETQNLQRRMAVMDRTRDIEKSIRWLETELDQMVHPIRAGETAAERTDTLHPDFSQGKREIGNVGRTDGDTSVSVKDGSEHSVASRSSGTGLALPNSATSSGASFASRGTDMEVSLGRSFSPPFSEKGQSPFKLPQSFVAMPSDGQTSPPIEAAARASPLLAKRKLLQSRTVQLLKELAKIREELHAAHGDALRLYVEGLMRRLKVLGSRAAAGEESVDPSGVIRAGLPSRGEPGYEEQSAQDDSELWADPLPKERPDDWAYRGEDPPTLGYDKMKRVFPAAVSLSPAPSEEASLSIPEPTAGGVISVTRRVRDMERLMEKRPVGGRPARDNLGEDESSASTRLKRLYEVMKENPGLSPADALARVKQKEGIN